MVGYKSLAGGRVSHIVLNSSIIARIGFAASYAFHQFAVDLPDQAFCDWIAAVQTIGNESKCRAVIQQLAGVIRIGFGNRFTVPQTFSLIQS